MPCSERILRNLKANDSFLRSCKLPSVKKISSNKKGMISKLEKNRDKSAFNLVKQYL